MTSSPQPQDVQKSGFVGIRGRVPRFSSMGPGLLVLERHRSRPVYNSSVSCLAGG